MTIVVWHVVLVSFGLLLTAALVVLFGATGQFSPVPGMAEVLCLLPRSLLAALALLGGSAWSLWALGRAADAMRSTA